MDRRQFTRQEALRRARHEYGLHPYEPKSPCAILGGGVEYRCGCGYTTTSAGEIYDHCHKEHSPTGEYKQFMLPLVGT